MYGRKDKGTGCLVNMTDGGEGTVGYRWTNEKREKITGQNHHNFGKILFKDKEKISGINNHNFGKSFSQEHRNKIGLSNKNKRRNEDFINQRKGENSSTAKLVIDSQTGIFYGCAKEAAVIYNINYSTLKGYLRGTNPNKTSLIYC